MVNSNASTGSVICLGLHHPGVVVQDLDKAVTFYCEFAGFEKVRNTSWSEDNTAFNQVVGLKGSAASLCLLRNRNCFLELFEYSSPASTVAPESQGANEQGIRHLCFEVNDVRRALAKVIALGGSKINEPVTNDAGTTATYCRDPFGNLLELIAPAGPFPTLRSLNHSP